MATLTLTPSLKNEFVKEILGVLGGFLMEPAKSPVRANHARFSSPMESVQAVDWLSTLTDNSDQVRQYCAEHEILSETVIAVRMAQRIFPPESRFSLELDEDPEINQKKLVVNVTVSDTVEEVLKCYKQFSREWVSSVSWPKRSRIRLSYDID